MTTVIREHSKDFTKPTTSSRGNESMSRPVSMSPRHRFDEQLQGLFQDMVEMGIACSEMLQKAVEALTTQDNELVSMVLRMDDAVDLQEERIEAGALRLLALQQPVLASDLRLVSMAMKAVTDIERIGDQCVNIAKIARRMSADGIIYQPLMDVERFKQLVAAMLEDTIHSIVRHDIERAKRVIAADDEVDILYQETQRLLREKMLSGEPGIVIRASHQLFVAHYLERIGDHCVGIAERLLFMETGAKLTITHDDLA